MRLFGTLTVVFFMTLPVVAGSAQEKPFSADDIDNMLENSAPMPLASGTVEDRLKQEIQACWVQPIFKRGDTLPEIKVAVSVGKDGTLLKDPKVLKTGKGTMGKQLAVSAVRAIKRCAPFKTVKDNPGSYENLRTIILNFQPSSL